MKRQGQKLKKRLTQGLSVFLSALMVAQSTTPALGYLSTKNGVKTVAGNEGQTIEEEADWIETYPNGVFALKDNTVHVYEDGGEKKITVYRLGGREGEATVCLALIPAAAAMDEEGESYNYANAAGALDVKIRVEDPVEEMNSDAECATGSDAANATGSNVSKTAVSDTTKESTKSKTTYTELETDEDNPYETMFIDLEFADGEWVKDILISAVDDEEHEPEELLLVMIYDSDSAEVLESANRTTVVVNDNEEALDSVMGFQVESVRIDKAEGEAVLTLTRTGGIQYVSQVDYYTENGTAEAGKDYVESDGSIGFACGLDEAEITIELIDDGKVSVDEDDDVTFYVYLTDPKAGTIDENAAVIEVSLYNSGTAESRNLATMTHMPEAEDVSAALVVSDTPIAEPAGNESVAGEVSCEEKTEVEVESVDVALGEVQSNPMARTFTYTAPMQFGANKGNWKSYAVIAGSSNISNTSTYDNVNLYAASSSLLGQNVSGSAWFWRYGKTVGTSQDKERTKMTFSGGNWTVQTDNTVQASLKIDRLYDRYDRLDYKIYFESDRSSIPWKFNAVYGYVGKYNSSNAGEYSDSYGDKSSGAGNYINDQVGTSKVAFNNDGVAYGTSAQVITRDKAFKLGSVNGNNASTTVTDTINLEAAADSGVIQYNRLKDYNYLYFMVETSADRDIFGKIQIQSAALRRQALNTNPVVRVHTADDKMLDEMRTSGSDTQKSIAENIINNKLAPSVSLVDGGTNGSGNLYIGSQIKVTPNTTSATYSSRGQIRLLDKADNYVAGTANVSGGSGTIRLQFSSDSIRTTKDSEFYVDLALDRKQQVIFNYAGSIDVDNDGIKTEAEKSAALADISGKLAGATMVCGTYDEGLTSGTHKFYKDKDYALGSSLTLNSTKERYEAASVTNLKSINFHMDSDDVILFNGQMYAGNEEIPISVNELELTTLEFQFYDSSCLALVRDMEITSISSVSHYVDYNENGKLDIEYDPETGLYETVAVDGVKDFYIGNLSEGSYTASDLEPVVIDGKVYQQLLFVRYNMIPRSLRVPEGADANETCLVIPNFTTIVTNEEKNANQSEEMLGYRAIDGDDSMEQLVYTEAASIGYVAFPVGGDYSPARYVELDNGGYEVEWNPEWHGSLLVPFDDPEAIALDNTLMPQNGYVVADTEDEVNAYLGSMHGNDTFSLTLHYNNETVDTILGTFRLQPEMGSVTMEQTPTGTIGLDQKMSKEEVNPPSNTSDSDPEIKLPTMNVGLGPMDLIMDGDTVGFSVGVPIFSKTWYSYSAKNNTEVDDGTSWDDDATEDDENDYQDDETPKYTKSSAELGGWLPQAAADTVNLYREALGNLGSNSIKKQLKDATNRGTEMQMMDSDGNVIGNDTVTYGTNYAKPFKNQTAKSFNVALNFTFLWKYSNLSHKFEFDQAAVFMYVGGSVKLSVYPEPIHVVYVFVAFSADFSAGLGMEMVEYANADGTRGAKLDFSGIDLGIDLAIEAGAGAGVDLLYAEVYVRFTVGVAGSFLTPEADASFDTFSTTGAVALRFMLLFLDYQMDLVGYEFGYDKARDDTKWYFRWHALGDMFGDEVVTFSLRDEKEEVEEKYAAQGMTISWPESLTDEQNFYSPEENLPNPRLRSYTIPDVPFEVSGYNSSVSAYSLVDNLGSGSGYELLTWTDENGENHNYLLYMIQMEKSEDSDQGLQNSTLVLSELVSKSADGNTGLGVTHPLDKESGERYLVIDAAEDGIPDVTGDLDFSAYVDEDGLLSVTWVSYVDDGILTASAANAAAEMSRKTVVKHAMIDLGAVDSDAANHGVDVVYDWDSDAGYRFQPVAVDQKVTVFAEAYHYDEDELETLKEEYAAYYETENGGAEDDDGEDSGTGNPLAGAYAALNYDIDRVFGNYSTLNISVASTGDGEDSWQTYKFDMGDSWKKNLTRIDCIVMTPAKAEDGTDAYYLAYVTTGTVMTADVDEKQMVKQLFLQKLTLSEGHEPELGSPILLRTLVDNDKDSSKDGIYVASKLSEPYENPYFENLNFLHGALETNADGEPVMEDFFLFGMNGNTYAISEDSLEVLLNGANGQAEIRPFFEIKTFINGNGDEVQETDIRSNVIIGADGDGNISAVYTDTVPNTVNNALYICKYDPTIEGWGAPVMLAMKQMQVYEDSLTNGWDSEVTSEKYFVEKTVDGVTYAGDKFVFEAPAIALGQEGELLVVTRGVLTNLTTGSYTNTYGETVTEYIPAVKNGHMDSSTGYYAIAYGIGNQKISEASLTFNYYNFSEGANLTPYIRFRNTGDTAIRASEAQPAVIRLMAAKVARDDEADVTEVDSLIELMKWEVKENILAGAVFDSRGNSVDGLLPTADMLPQGIEEMTLYFTVSEDSSYIESTGGTVFSWSSLDEGEEGVSFYTVGSKPELSFGSLSVGAEGHTTVTPLARSIGSTVTTYVDMEIINSGSEDADGLKVMVEYSNGKNADGTRIWNPVDTGMTGNTLLAGNEWKLEVPSSMSRMRSSAAGIFSLVKEDGTAVTTLSAGSGINVSGTMTLPAEYYDESDSTKSMNLRFTVLCDNEEYTTENNGLYRSLEAASLFDVPGNVNLTLGNTVEIPISISTTRQGIEPAVTIRELTGVGGEVTKTLFDSLYYNPETEILTMVPGKLGSGIIRVADINTGSFTDILFTINAEGVNIVTTNPAIEFETGTTLWRDKQYYEGIMDVLPYLNDTAVGGKNNIFTFTTFADNIDLYFKGTIRVWIDGNDFGYMNTKYVSDNLFNPVLINFKNHKLKECEVTVMVYGDEAEFDKYVEFYGARGLDSGLMQGTTIRNQKDTADPIIIYGKSIPEDSSVSKDAAIEFPIYFIDNRGIQAATVDGIAADEYFADAKAAVKTLNISGNTGYTLRVRDSAAREVVETLDVMWFGGNGTLTEDSWPHYEAYVDASDPENPVLVIESDAGKTGEVVSVSMLDLSSSKSIEEISVADSDSGASGLSGNLSGSGGRIVLVKDGLYLVRVTNADGMVQTIPVWVTEVPDMEVTAVIRRQPDEDQLYYMVQCSDGVKADYFLYGSEDDELDESDVLLKQSERAANSVSGVFDIPEAEERYPYYILMAVPEDGDEDDAVINTYCMLAKLTKVEFNVEDTVWTNSFSPEIDEFTVRVPLYDEYGNDYNISSTEITGFKLAIGSEDTVVKIVQAADSADGATAVVTVTEGGVTNTYTFHFINDGCTCSMASASITGETKWMIGADESEIEIPLSVVTDRGTCQIEDHNDMELKYRIEILDGEEIARVGGAEGNVLIVSGAGTVTVRVTVYGANYKPVTSEAVTLIVTKEKSVSDETEKDTESGKDDSGWDDSETSGGSKVGASGTQPDYVKSRKLYLANGATAMNCWVMVKGIWYYAGPDGHALTGWFLDPANGYWYFLNEETGAMKTGWHLDSQDGYWYYLQPVNGEMLLGWQNINEKYYYLNPVAAEPTWYLENGIWKFSGTSARPFGSMYAGEQTPDGAYVGNDGARIRR